jgi:S-DNA-T family DNA segregation ATPase FtsK/SpoIIIE
MASYQMRQRDPLLDRNMQAMLERRGKELLGLLLLALAGAVALTLWSYTPEDPGWMVATDEPARNLMGRLGASVASTLIIICGLGAWGVPLVFLAWGIRFLLHRGEDRALGRIVFAVIAVAIGSVFAATHVPGEGWTHSFGLGGLFGDTILGALLGMMPVGAGLGLKLVSVMSGVALLVMGLYVTGFSPAEVRALLRFLLVGLVMTYAALAGLATRGASGTAQAAQALRDRRADRRADGPALAQGLTDAGPPLRRVEPGLRAALPEPPVAARPAAVVPSPLADVRPAPRERGGLLSRVPQLLALRPRDPEPELVEPPLSPWDEAGAPSEERIRSRISDAIRARERAQPMVDLSTPVAARAEPAVARRRGPKPLIASLQRTIMPAGLSVATPVLSRVEPPVTLARRADPATDAEWDDGSEDWDEDDTGAARAELDGDEAYDDEDDAYPATDPMPRMVGVTPDARHVVQPAAARPTVPSRQALAEAQPRLRFDDRQPAYEVPPLSLLASPSTVQRFSPSVEALEENARMLESVLDDYGVKGEITSVRPGPVVTMYELEPAPGLKASRVIGLADDIARSMSALSARVSTVPGRTVIGIELPNAQREKVVLREILSARDFGDSTMRLPLALGKDIGGGAVVANLAKMPHLLIAGTTGSGKSVAINTMILSLLYKLTPEECRLIMIDPKMLELSVYDGIPHLLSPVVTDPKKAVVALKWVVGEMEERYRKMSRMGVRNIEGYNGRVREALSKGEMFKRTIQTGFDDDTGDPVFETEEFQPVTIPYIVVVVDEMADLMMVAGKEIEACIQRLAQMARASGIHLIMATQRPSVDVITGTIKANFPTRISFQVTSKIDSRTILGEQGAEQLLGMGDMLYMAGGAKITRIHGPFVSDEEVEEIVTHLKSFGPPVYMSGVVEGVEDDKAEDIDLVLGLGGEASDDALYDQAVAVVAKDRKCSTSYIQRKLGIGYNKAAKLVEQMEELGVVSTANHVGKREVLVPER